VHFSTRLQAQGFFASARGVKWTSPQHFTMALTRVTFALKRACKKEERYTVKGSAGRANLKIYFEPGVLPTLKFATQEIYSLLLCKHLIPRFGAIACVTSPGSKSSSIFWRSLSKGSHGKPQTICVIC